MKNCKNCNHFITYNPYLEGYLCPHCGHLEIEQPLYFPAHTEGKHSLMMIFPSSRCDEVLGYIKTNIISILVEKGWHEIHVVRFADNRDDIAVILHDDTAWSEDYIERTWVGYRESDEAEDSFGDPLFYDCLVEVPWGDETCKLPESMVKAASEFIQSDPEPEQLIEEFLRQYGRTHKRQNVFRYIMGESLDSALINGNLARKLKDYVKMNYNCGKLIGEDRALASHMMMYKMLQNRVAAILLDANYSLSDKVSCNIAHSFWRDVAACVVNDSYQFDEKNPDPLKNDVLAYVENHPEALSGN